MDTNIVQRNFTTIDQLNKQVRLKGRPAEEIKEAMISEISAQAALQAYSNAATKALLEKIAKH